MSQFVSDDCRTVVAPAFAAKNFRHLAGTKAKARWNATTTADAPTATDNAKWDPRRVGYYRARFEEETACLRVAARRKRETDKGPSPESKYFKPLARFSKRKFNQSRG